MFIRKSFWATLLTGTTRKIQAANPGVKLPDQNITVVVRSDSSGTSYVFTNHLAAISDNFKEQVGGAKAPNWPSAGTIVKAPKNDGVTADYQTNAWRNWLC